MDQVEEIKKKTDIVQLILEYIPLKKAGRNYKANCPFHGEKTPSFMVNPELQIFKCFGCGVGGDALSFLEKMEGMEFGEALQSLAKRVGVKLVSYKPSKTEESRERLVGINALAAEAYHYLLTKHKLGEKAREYLKKRGVEEEAVEKYKLGFAPGEWDFLIKYLRGKKGYRMDELDRVGLVAGGGRYDRFRDRIIFPLNNHRGQTMGFAGRIMPGADDKAGAKYVNTMETELYHKSELLYGLDVTRGEIKLAGFVVVVEGEIDAIASWQAGVKNVVAIKGSALTEKQVELLRRLCDTIVLGLDADKAGDAASRRGIEIAERMGMIIKVIGDKYRDEKYKDPGEWAIMDPEGWKKAVDGAIPIYDFYLESAVKRYGLEAIGKGKIGKELLPIWVKIPDEIVKAHYVKQLAQVLGVAEKAVSDEMAKLAGGGRGGINIGKDEKKQVRGRWEVLEEYLVKLALVGNQVERLEKKEVREKIKNAFWERVVEELLKTTGDNVAERVRQLPGELRPRVEALLMTDEEVAGDKWEKDWKRTLAEIEEMEIREKIQEYKVDEAKFAEVARLVRRLEELTRAK